MGKRKGAYDDDLTPEEEAAITAADQSTELPPAEDDDADNPPPTDQQPAPAPAEQPKAAEEPQPAAQPEAQPQAQPSEEDELKAFVEKHKDKSPEEIARLAFQQTKRANRGEATARVANQNLQALADRAKAAIERRNLVVTAAGEKKTGFREKLQSDPDAATAEVHDRLVDQDLAAADAEVDRALVEQAVGFARAYVPDFDNRWDGMKELGTELGYTPQEIANIRDGRDIVVLSLAEVAAKLMKGGIIDVRGNLIAMPQPTQEPTDPRLKGPDPVQTLGSGGARASDGTPSAEQQLQNMLSMSDADFDKLDPAQLESILRAAG